ncbi:hypothetical protein [Capnocytophaga sp. G2]|jgi:hypothetical protein|nr:hypothetical protein [Capnocytophaga sp. G2]MEB3005428.1 hypothetical protein [Capnocytophaga sp. G2]
MIIFAQYYLKEIKEKETLIAICLGAIAKVEAQINLGKVGKALN